LGAFYQRIGSGVKCVARTAAWHFDSKTVDKKGLSVV